MLVPFEKAVFQIVLAASCIEDSVLQAHLLHLKKDISYEGSLHQAFSHINQSIRPYALELRTVVLKKTNADGGSSALVYYHAIANTEDDTLSKEIKAYSEKEIVFFRSLLEKMLEEKYLSMNDIKALKGTDIDVKRFLERLHEHGWLQRDDRNYWEFGIHHSPYSGSFLVVHGFLQVPRCTLS